MKGKNRFTKNEIYQLKKLIAKKVISSKYEQKKIRDKIRNIGFYFTDFSNKKGYTVNDLEILINSGLIEIVETELTNKTGRIENEGDKVTFNNSFKKTSGKGKKPTIVKTLSELNNPEFGLSPLFYSEIRYLILGTFPARESINENFYYQNQNKRFWGQALNSVGNLINSDTNIRKGLLLQKKIGLWDVFEAVEREESNQDSAIKKALMSPINKFSQILPNLEFLLFNGKNTYEWLLDEQPELFSNSNINCIRFQSTSGSNGWFNNGVDWNEFFNEQFSQHNAKI